MTCNNCGAEITEGMNFCTACGSKLENVSEGVSVEQNTQNETVMVDAASAQPVMVDAANPPQTGNADATANPYAAPNQNGTGGKKLSPLKGPGPGIASLAIAGGSILLEIVCALLGDMPCMALLLPIVALVLGIVGVAQNRRKKGIAIAGIILSVVAMIVTFMVFVSVMITAWNSV